MARYGDETTAADVGAIDVLSLAPRISASAFFKSAFMPGIQAQEQETRVGVFGQQEARTWGTIDLDDIGKVLGILEVGIFIGGAIGPYLGGLIFDTTGSYSLAFVVTGTAVLLRILLVALVRSRVSLASEQQLP